MASLDTAFVPLSFQIAKDKHMFDRKEMTNETLYRDKIYTNEFLSKTSYDVDNIDQGNEVVKKTDLNDSFLNTVLDKLDSLTSTVEKLTKRIVFLENEVFELTQKRYNCVDEDDDDVCVSNNECNCGDNVEKYVCGSNVMSSVLPEKPATGPLTFNEHDNLFKSLINREYRDMMFRKGLDCPVSNEKTGEEQKLSDYEKLVAERARQDAFYFPQPPNKKPDECVDMSLPPSVEFSKITHPDFMAANDPVLKVVVEPCGVCNCQTNNSCLEPPTPSTTPTEVTEVTKVIQVVVEK